jgi:hypothetical protein
MQPTVLASSTCNRQTSCPLQSSTRRRSALAFTEQLEEEAGAALRRLVASERRAPFLANNVEEYEQQLRLVVDAVGAAVDPRSDSALFSVAFCIAYYAVGPRARRKPP